MLLLVLTCFLTLFLDYGVKTFFSKIHRRCKTDISNVNFDIVFFGSSRVIHGLNNKLFNNCTNISSLNMGWPAVNPREVYAAIEVFLFKNYKPKYIFIQVDEEHDLIEEDKSAQFELLKFYSKSIIDDYYSDNARFIMDFPLLASMKNRDFGWREVLKTTFRNNLYEEMETKNFGYVKIEPKAYEESPNAPIIPNQNKNVWISKSIESCKKRGVKVILYTAPYFYENIKDRFDFLKIYGVPYYNFSNLLKSKKSFKDYNHTNSIGTDSLTMELAKTFNEQNAL
jgi:hypothetical protein